jgi:hypothetical protein
MGSTLKARAAVERWLAVVRDVAAGIPIGSGAPVEQYGAATPRRIKVYPSLQENIHGTMAGHRDGHDKVVWLQLQCVTLAVLIAVVVVPSYRKGAG